MHVLIALIFMIGSASAFLNDPEGTRYYIKNAFTNKYLFVDRPEITPSNLTVASNVCIGGIANKIPSPRPNSMFHVVANDAIGPYYNILNFGTNSTLFASEFEASIERNKTVCKVMAWMDADHKNSPESLWNIRHFNNDLYILNVYSGSYLYTNDNMNSNALLRDYQRLALLMPSEEVGRVKGTQWLLIKEVVGDGTGVVVNKERVEGQRGNVAEENVGGLDEQGENVTKGGCKKKVGKLDPVDDVTEGKVQQVSEEGGARRHDHVENTTVEGGEGTKGSEHNGTNVAPKGFDYKIWALRFNCHTTTTRRPRTTSKFNSWWPYERNANVTKTTVGETPEWPCPGLVGTFKGTTEHDEFEETEGVTNETQGESLEEMGNVNGTGEIWEWEKEHKKEKNN